MGNRDRGFIQRPDQFPSAGGRGDGGLVVYPRRWARFMLGLFAVYALLMLAMIAVAVATKG